MRFSRLAPLVLLLLLSGRDPVLATGWLTGPSSYTQAVQAMAAARWKEAQTLIEAANPDQGRVDWVMHLLRERRESEAGSGYRSFERSGDSAGLRPSRAVGHCYAHHNIYLFLRSEGIQGELLQDAYERAEHIYQVWHRVHGKNLPESLRWPFAGLLYEGDQIQKVTRLLEETRAEGALPHGIQGPDASEVSRFKVGFQMLLAYFHTARGDEETALAYLRGALEAGGQTVRGWITQSDDFWKLRNSPPFQALLKD